MQFMSVLTTGIAIVVALFGLVFIVGNWIILYLRINYKGTSSIAPIIGGVCVMIAFLLYKPLRNFWWVAFILDISFAEILYWLVIYLIKKLLKK